ncbi:hypothetical protein [Variovorax sp. JS1663]|uniref:hypothetical protein n=1 Tax=Variovorax sp. JS1663 TaxID=1851577 RepID=UPI00117C379B|nr:hypothetical protein [Variovorax sp. JS1663]
MLELGIGADILRGVGWIVRLLFLAAIVYALWSGGNWKRKLLKVTLVVLLFSTPLWPGIGERIRYERKYKVAKVIFDQRCKTAGERIYKRVDNVEGVLLLNIRERSKSSDRSDPNWPDAALANERYQEGYVASFLQWEHHEDKRSPRGYLNYAPSDLPGYGYVDVRGDDGLLYRYTLDERGNPDSRKLSKSFLNGKPARYAVSFVNMIDPGDREYWIAGTTVTVTDVQTKEVLAHSTWYAMDPGQGSTAGARAPWGFARTCPELKGWVGAPTRMFVDQVLKPK